MLMSMEKFQQKNDGFFLQNGLARPGKMIKRSFLKTGIAVAIDGSEDDHINVEGLKDYDIDSDGSSSDNPFSDSEGSPSDLDGSGSSESDTNKED